jgi:hypothetical protein
MGLWDKLRQVSTDLRKLRLSRGPGSYYQYKWKREDERKRADREHERAEDDARSEHEKAEREHGYDERYIGERERQTPRKRTEQAKDTDPQP